MDLEQIAARYRAETGAHWSTPAQRKRAAEDAAKALRKARTAVLELQRCGGGHLLAGVDAEALRLAAERCAETAERIPDAPMRGKVPDYAMQHLIQRLHCLYRTKTGEQHRYTHGRDKDGYHGPFIDYAMQAATDMGIELTPQRIAECLDSAD